MVARVIIRVSMLIRLIAPSMALLTLTTKSHYPPSKPRKGSAVGWLRTMWQGRRLSAPPASSTAIIQSMAGIA